MEFDPSRRRFLATAGVVALTVATGSRFFNNPENNKPNDLETALPPTGSVEGYPSLYDSAEANEVADRLGLNVGEFFKISPETIARIESRHGYLEDTLLPIFPPGVARHRDAIESAAAEYDVPPNILATLATIESAGISDAQSAANAHGLIQVVPRYHRDRIDSVAGRSFDNDEQRAEALQDVTLNTKVAANFLAELIEGVKNANPDLPEPVVFARAAASYNGGPANATRSFEDFALESKLYVNHMIRITLDLAVAHELRAMGMDDQEVLRAMQSNEINARAYAYSQYSRSTWEDYEYSAYLCSLPEPGVNPNSGIIEQSGELINEGYKDYLADPSYETPAPGGIRIWLCGGGVRLFSQVPENVAWTLQ